MVGVSVLVVHLFADLDAPFSHFEGEPHIERNGQHNDRQVPDVKQEKQHDRDHQKLKNQRPHRKQQKAQQKVDAFDPAFNNPRQTARLAGDVIAHRQAVDMGKGLKRQLPQGPLPDLGKDHIAQLLKAHRHQTRQTVSQRQPNRTEPQNSGRVSPFRGQGINGLFIKDRGPHGDDLGQQQNGQSNDHTASDPALPLWPQIGHDPFDHAPSLNLGITQIGIGFS